MFICILAYPVSYKYTKLVLLTAITQGIGAVLGGFLNDKIGSKKIIQLCLYCVFLSILGLVFFQDKISFVLIFQFGAFFFGTLQSASRVMMTNLINENNLGQGFGLFTLASRSTAILGPIMIGSITYFTNLNFGFLSITILILAGILMIKKVNVPKSY